MHRFSMSSCFSQTFCLAIKTILKKDAKVCFSSFSKFLFFLKKTGGINKQRKGAVKSGGKLMTGGICDTGHIILQEICPQQYCLPQRFWVDSAGNQGLRKVKEGCLPSKVCLGKYFILVARVILVMYFKRFWFLSNVDQIDIVRLWVHHPTLTNSSSFL